MFFFYDQTSFICAQLLISSLYGCAETIAIVAEVKISSYSFFTGDLPRGYCLHTFKQAILKCTLTAMQCFLHWHKYGRFCFPFFVKKLPKSKTLEFLVLATPTPQTYYTLEGFIEAASWLYRPKPAHNEIPHLYPPPSSCALHIQPAILPRLQPLLTHILILRWWPRCLFLGLLITFIYGGWRLPLFCFCFLLKVFATRILNVSCIKRLI